MPELPEVETTARGLRGLVVGKRVAHVTNVDWPRMLPNTNQADLEQALAGKRITAVRRRGKTCCWTSRTIFGWQSTAR